MVKSDARFARVAGQGLSGGRRAVHGPRETEPGRAPTRIQRKNRTLILEAALDVFSAQGFRGSTIDQIAARAGMSKPNLLYYFPTKKAIYVALVESILAEWLQPLAEMDPQGDPVAEIGRYIDAKLRMSRLRPEASRLFANEILHGAPDIRGFLQGPLRALVDEKAAVIHGWIAAGRLAAIDPHHLIFMIWAVTQHYADFEVQVRAVLGEGDAGTPHPAELGSATIQAVFFDGLRPRGGRAVQTSKSCEDLPGE
jgi:TetR/AcrR family transcriptional regulator